MFGVRPVVLAEFAEFAQDVWLPIVGVVHPGSEEPQHGIGREKRDGGALEHGVQLRFVWRD